MKTNLTLFSGLSAPLFMFLIVVACAQSSQKGADVLSPKEFSEQLKKDPSIVLIDVRTSDEMKDGYLEGAINLDFNNPGFQKSIDSLDHSRKYFVYCAAGIRSGKAMKMMKSAGFKDVVSLDGGINGWKAQGLPVVH